MVQVADRVIESPRECSPTLGAALDQKAASRIPSLKKAEHERPEEWGIPRTPSCRLCGIDYVRVLVSQGGPMQILQTIQAHAAAMRLPLYAVTLSAVAKPDTPVILILHWHGFRRESVLKLSDIDLPLRSVAGSALQINTSWQAVE